MTRKPSADYADPPDQPPPDEPPPAPEKPPLSAEEARTLLRAGTRLVRRGDDPKHWVTMVRVGDDYALASAATDEAIDELVNQDLVVAD